VFTADAAVVTAVDGGTKLNTFRLWALSCGLEIEKTRKKHEKHADSCRFMPKNRVFSLHFGHFGRCNPGVAPSDAPAKAA
jgi:hypothetical protein